ncbi:YigZ family protein [Aquitalea palustris]|uniref:YigZ family protein n=1 Tax=Aquitalea palustris TaxID=2480983 RepID=A0A454JEB0_9NEIS|nr:YigZ family protein [Aquitalea palustris]RMC92954.1 YigZ family protein [Aquitalea palustris]
MFQLAAPVVAEIEIKKSRFIAALYPVQDRAEAMAHLVALRQQWPDARHYCAVLLVSGDSMLDDDGEPSGTAARPMYNVLMHKQLHNVLAVVVRYFGGIKLGAGGLVRAYTQAVNAALQTAQLQPVVLMQSCLARVGFASESRLRHCCAELAISVIAAEYGEQVVLTLSMPQAQSRALQTRLHDLLAGEVYFMTDES